MRLVALTSLLAVSTPALAQSNVLSDAPAPQPVVIVKPVTELEFGELRVDGAAERPAGALVTETARPDFGSLLHLRTSFDAELEASARLVR
jgi:hypothetical protein